MLHRLTPMGLALLMGCTGSIGDGGLPTDAPAEGEQPVDCSVMRPGRAPMRRLTRNEYDNTVAFLFDDASRPATRLMDDERGVVSADARTVTTLLANQYMVTAEDVSERATEDLDALLPCDRGVDSEDACAQAFVAQTGRRAFRRPVSTDESERLMTLFQVLRDEQGFRGGVRGVIEAMLQSPAFLYRVELPAATADAIVRLDAYQLATRLAFLLWQSAPDDALLDRAEAGDLDTDAGVASVASEMLTDARAEPAIQAFFHHYLELDQLDELTKDEATFPDFNPEIAELMGQETEAFVREVLSEESGDWRTLLTADWTMLNGPLAEYYGIEGVTGDDFVRVDVDPNYHSGLLTHGSVMATRGRSNSTHPVHRGMFVRAKLLCGDVPDVPEGLVIDPPDPDPTLTYREQLVEHRSEAYCASCHALMDPLGFAFEHFGGDGRFRLDDNGLDIDATGDIVGSDVNGSFDGAPDLAQHVIASEQAQECFGGALFEFGIGRALQREDQCSVQTMMESFHDEGFDVRRLLVSLTQTEAFLHRVVDQDQFPSPPLGMMEAVEGGER